MSDLAVAVPALKPWLDEMAEVAAYLWEKGWAERNAGNVSVDVTPVVAGAALPAGLHERLAASRPELGGHYLLVSGTGRRFRDLARGVPASVCLIRIDDDGAGYQVVGGDDGAQVARPTFELPAHLAVHQSLVRRGASERVVLHTHPTELIALTLLSGYQDEAAVNRALFSVHPEVKVTVPRGVGLAPYVLPGSEALARATVAAFERDHPVVLWAKHGCLAVGTGVVAAFDPIDTLNKAAQLVLLCRGAGQQPDGLSAADLAELVRVFKLRE
ncbi:MAG: rhamnulose-1-phosphate aldolase [Deltaproteobacteria bacterium]|nr:rhamnulose-1-phosphate aldolase [Deltaproteobacteria bacterium]